MRKFMLGLATTLCVLLLSWDGSTLLASRADAAVVHRGGGVVVGPHGAVGVRRGFAVGPRGAVAWRRGVAVGWHRGWHRHWGWRHPLAGAAVLGAATYAYRHGGGCGCPSYGGDYGAPGVGGWGSGLGYGWGAGWGAPGFGVGFGPGFGGWGSGFGVRPGFGFGAPGFGWRRGWW